MEIQINITHDSGHIIFKGQFTFCDHDEFRKCIDLVRQKEISRISIDLSDVTFIDSAGLGMLLLLRDECMKKTVELRITGATGQVHKIFMISKFDQLFDLG